jgi:protein-disulfide isomerase
MGKGGKIALIVAVIIAVGVGGFFLGRMTKKAGSNDTPPGMARRGDWPTPNPNQPPTPPPPPERMEVNVEGLPSKGPANAPITILEISDFECPFCTRGWATMDQILQAYPGKIRLTFRNFPLQFHQNARPAAEAALSAGDQGKFWEMYDKIFSSQASNRVDRQNLINYAKELKLDMKKFTKCLDEQCHREQIDRDIQESMKLGVNGTPCFFINGKRLVGAQPYEIFKQMIDEELAKAK